MTKAAIIKKKTLMLITDESFVFPETSILKIFSNKTSINAIKKIKEKISSFHAAGTSKDIKSETEEEIAFVSEEINVKTSKYKEADIDFDECILTFKKASGELYEVGIKAFISKVIEYNKHTYAALIFAMERVVLTKITTDEKNNLKYAEYKAFDTDYSGKEIEAIKEVLTDLFLTEYIGETNISSKSLRQLKNEKNPEVVTDIIAKYANLTTDDQYKVLTEKSLEDRMKTVLTGLQNNIEITKTKKKIKSSIKKNIESDQKNFFLREQLKVIQKELGDDDFQEALEIEDKISKINAPEEVKKKLLNELNKLKKMSFISAEAGVIRNYLECAISLPWDNIKESNKDIKKAEEILNQDHYGLKDVKERILEYIAVYNKISKEKSTKTILCLLGPPGVGKTSIAKSISKALDRPFVKVSLGGVNDESDIRGHRRTYVAAMPGRIIEAIKTAQTSNPVILLDEIDKMSKDGRGDPSSALLEVLDPEQNQRFRDHYLDIDYDLSKVIFIATANECSMPLPLFNRLEVINLSGYTTKEKIFITKNHIIPKVAENHELKDIKLTEKEIEIIINDYTKEPGVRSLERKIEKIARKIIRNKTSKIKNIEDFLGSKNIDNNICDKKNKVGFINGLAYTSYGGEILATECRGSLSQSSGKIKITGNTKKIMNESVEVALTYIKSEFKNLMKELYINPIDLCEFYDIEYKSQKYIKYLTSVCEQIMDQKSKISTTFDLNIKLNKKAISTVISELQNSSYDLLVQNNYNSSKIKLSKENQKIKDIIYNNAIFRDFINYLEKKVIEKINKTDFHFHMPEGAIPKDGPSAGVCMVSLLFSVIFNKPARGDTSMTGEISLSGNIMAIGGLKEKILASLQHGVRNVIIPLKNEESIKEIKKNNPDLLEDLNVIQVDEIKTLLSIVFNYKDTDSKKNTQA